MEYVKLKLVFRYNINIFYGKAGLAKLNESELNTVIKKPYTTGQLLSTLDGLLRAKPAEGSIINVDAR